MAAQRRERDEERFPRFGAVVVSYAQHESAAELARALRVESIPVVVVETSPLAWEGSAVPDGTTLVHVDNLGYGAAVNLGAATLIERSAGRPSDFLLVSNGDCSLDAVRLKRLLTGVAEDGRRHSAFAVPQETPDGEAADWLKVFPGPRAHLLFLRRRDRAHAYAPRSSLYPNGAFFIVETDVFVRLRGFDPRFFLYYEETDLFYRLRSDGNSIAFLSGVAIGHAGSSATARHRVLTTFELGRSSGLYGRKHALRLGSYAATYGIYGLALLGLQALRLNPRAALAAAGRLAGFAVGLSLPRFEPLRFSRIEAAPYARREATRRRLIESAVAAGIDTA